MIRNLLFFFLMTFWFFAAAQPSSTRMLTVVDEQGNPLSGAQVVLFPSGSSLSVSNTGLIPDTIMLETDSIVVFQPGYSVKRWVPPYPSILRLSALKDSIGEVVITATRTEKSIEDVPNPMQVVSRSEIQEMGAIRLQDVLGEQTGLQITSNHGTGVQMQGLSSDYVLILIDDEPVIGRTAGTLNLNRLTTGNIERIEIVKGPASSLYGSEAMAGVINIITSQPKSDHSLELTTSLRRFNTSDVGVNYGSRGNNWKASIMANRYHTDGPSFTAEEDVIQLPQNTSYTFQPKVAISFSEKWDASMSLRGFIESQQQQFDIELTNNEQVLPATNIGELQEWNAHVRINYKHKGHHLQIRPYYAMYNFNERLTVNETKETIDEGRFVQQFSRLEAQYDWKINHRVTSTFGAGINPQTVDATRFSERGRFVSTYAFFQQQYEVSEQLYIQGGARYDGHSAYANRLSPKLAAQYRFSKTKTRINASIGSGYKAPDFRQLLLDFNNTAGGYGVLGSNYVEDRLSELQAQGRIQSILWDPQEIGNLRPETSWTTQFGFSQPLRNQWIVKGHFFYHLINDLIETTPIARQTNGQTIFSYRNVNQVRSRGVEIQLDGKINKAWGFSFGYQFLDMKDLRVVSELEEGTIFRRLPNGEVERVAADDYLGLFNRSRHSGNGKVFFNKDSWQFSLRAIYRSAFPFGDTNGNQIADNSTEMAASNLLLNLMISKAFNNQFRLEAGANNLLNQTNAFEPNVFGTLWFVGIRWNANWNKNNE